MQEQPLQAGMVQCFDNKLNQKASCMLHFLKAFTSSNAKLFSPLRQTEKLKPFRWKILLPSDGTTHREVGHSRWAISHNFSRAMLSKYIPRPYLPWYCVTQSGPTAIFASRVWKTPVGHKQKRLGTRSCFKDKQTCINARFPPINFHCRFAQSMFPTFALETKKK